MSNQFNQTDVNLSSSIKEGAMSDLRDKTVANLMVKSPIEDL